MIRDVGYTLKKLRFSGLNTTVILSDKNGLPINLTGGVVKLLVKDTLDETNYLIEHTLTNIDPTNGKARANIASLNLPTGKYHFDIVFIDSLGMVFYPLYGTLIIIESVNNG